VLFKLPDRFAADFAIPLPKRSTLTQLEPPQISPIVLQAQQGSEEIPLPARIQFKPVSLASINEFTMSVPWLSRAEKNLDDQCDIMQLDYIKTLLKKKQITNRPIRAPQMSLFSSNSTYPFPIIHDSCKFGEVNLKNLESIDKIAYESRSVCRDMCVSLSKT
jgi:hypothetical protein